MSKYTSDEYSSCDEEEKNYICKYCGLGFEKEFDLNQHILQSRKCKCIRETLFLCKKCYYSTDTLPSLYIHFRDCESSDSDENILERIGVIFLEKDEKIKELTLLTHKQKKIITKLKVKLHVEREKSKIFDMIIEKNASIKLTNTHEQSERYSLITKEVKDDENSMDTESKKHQNNDECEVEKKSSKYEKEIEYIEEEYEECDEEEECKEECDEEEECKEECEEYDEEDECDKECEDEKNKIIATCILYDIPVSFESDDESSETTQYDLPCLEEYKIIDDEYIEQNKERIENEVSDIKSCISYADSITWSAVCEQLRPNVRKESHRDISSTINKINEIVIKKHKNALDSVLENFKIVFNDIDKLRLDFSQTVDTYDNEVSLLSCDSKLCFNKVCISAEKLRNERLCIFVKKGVEKYLLNVREDVNLYMKKIESIEHQTRNENYVMAFHRINSFLSNFDQYMILTSVQRNRNNDIQQLNFNRCDCFTKIKQNEKKIMFKGTIPSPLPDDTLCKKIRKVLWYNFNSDITTRQKFETFKRNDFLSIFRNAIIGIKHIHSILDCYFRTMRFYPCIAYVSVLNQTHPHAFFVLEKIGQDGKRFWRHDFMLDDICSSVTSEINTIISEILTEFMAVFNTRTIDGLYMTTDLRSIHQTLLNNLFYTIDMKLFGTILRECIVKNCEYIFTQKDFIINLNLRQTMSTFSFRPTFDNLLNEFRSILINIFIEENITYRYIAYFISDKQMNATEGKIIEKWECVKKIVLDNVDKFLYCFPAMIQHVKDNFSMSLETFSRIMNITGIKNTAKRKEEFDDIETSQISEGIKNKMSIRIANEYFEKLRHFEISTERSVENICTIIENMEKKREKNFLKYTFDLYSNYLAKSR
jgi:hypothetical protein